MKKLCAILAVLSLAAFVGCSANNTSANHPGGPGAATNATNPATDKPLVGEAPDSFEVKPPTFATDIKQGETKQVEIDIKRGKNFDQDVTLSFHGADGKDLPEGLSFDPKNPVISKAEKKGVQVKMSAGDKAAVNKYEIVIVGKPEKGPEAKKTMTVEVKGK